MATEIYSRPLPALMQNVRAMGVIWEGHRKVRRMGHAGAMMTLEFE